MTRGGGYEVVESAVEYVGRVTSVRRDLVRMPDGDVSQRDVVVHPGAVGVVALNDRDEVLLVQQYRHPVGRAMWELPAGLLDVDGEPASAAARRELEEEGQVRASQWWALVDAHSSAGMTDEAFRVFLARGITDVPAAERFEAEHEERDLVRRWVPLDDALGEIRSGEITNAMCLIGVLSADAARRSGWSGLRPDTAPWPDRPGHQG